MTYISLRYYNVGTKNIIVNTCTVCILENAKLHRWMAENGFAPPPPREFCRHILSCRELKAESFKRCLHSVLRGISL